MTRTESDLTGALLDRRYRVGPLLARGGMSSVYRGVDTRLDRPVAVKIMDSRFADDRTFVERFEREARSAARLHHPHVVAVHDQGIDTSAGAEDHRAFLVMELVDGGTLRDVLDRHGALEVPLALTVFEQVLSALAAAHSAGLVHRDVKPENVLLGHGGDAGGVAKVGDFGLVRAVANAGSTSTSVILGTVAYLSPEQVTSGAADPRSDVYSAGILLYELLTGQVPYTADTALSVAYRHVNDDVPAPSGVAGALPPAVDELVLRATRRDAELRPPDAGALLAEVTRVRTELGIPHVAIPVQPRAVGDTGPGAATGGDGTDPEMDPETTVPAMPAVAGTAGPGPRGTQALPRDAVREHAPAPPGHTAGTDAGVDDRGFPSGPQGPPEDGPARPGGLRRVPLLVWALVGLLLVGGVGAGLWWVNDGRYITVPPVAGTEQDRAEDALRSAGLRPETVRERHNTTPNGTVIRTEPAEGARVTEGDAVTVVVSMGRPVVPDVRPGASVEQAQQAISEEQLEPRRDPEADRYSDRVPEGAVVALEPAPGSQANVGDAVTIVVSKGPPPTPVPDVSGQGRDQAFQALRNAGFEPYEAGAEFSQTVPAGRVVRTEPAAGGTMENGNRVGVVLSNAVEVPSVVGRRARHAVQILGEAGLGVEGGNGRGPISFVVGQSPEGGSLVRPGTTISLTVVP